MQCYSLLVDPAESELKGRDDIIDLAPPLTDFGATAGLIDQLDLLIVVYFAGALGKPAWILISLRRDWRWMEERDDSPWHPSLRLFRQSKLDDWIQPIAATRAALAIVRATQGSTGGRFSTFTRKKPPKSTP